MKDEWYVCYDETDELGDVIVASRDFTHDVCLTVTGDFAEFNDKLKYAESIADKLNRK